jgi:hypothetical protein
MIGGKFEIRGLQIPSEVVIVARNNSTMCVFDLELGNFGKGGRRREGRTAEFEFRSRGRIVGRMNVSKSIVRWYGPGESRGIMVLVEDLNELFHNAGPLESKRK